MAAASEVKEKHTKAEVDYGKGMPRSHCGICVHFRPPDECELVRGHVKATAWCKLFRKKANVK